jgi:hypothetical protein
MSDASPKAREAALRRQAQRLGLTLRKDRARRPMLGHLGGYQLADARTGRTIDGTSFELSLADVQELIDARLLELAGIGKVAR